MDLQEPFFSPRITGDRFHGTLPLAILEDLSAYEDLLIEVAKYIYVKKNPDRKRVPKGFNNGISLQLASVTDGSSIPNILLFLGLSGMFHNDKTYFEQARDTISEVVELASLGRRTNELIPDNLLKRFNRLGKNLQEGDAIEFRPTASTQRAILNRETRKTLILASGERYFLQSFSIRATVPGLHKEQRIATVRFGLDNEFSFEVSPVFYEVILFAHNNSEKLYKVLIKGVGRFNRHDKIESIDSLESISGLEPLDVASRLQEFLKLENGWLNGDGNEFNAKALNWFGETFEELFDTKLPLPYVFPMVDGGVKLEWNTDTRSANLEVNLHMQAAEYYQIDKTTREYFDEELSLASDEGWNKLNAHLLAIFNI